MNYYEFPKTRPWKCLFVLFLTALLFLSRDTLAALNLVGFHRSQFLLAAILVLTAIVFLIRNRRSIPDILKDSRMLVALAAIAVMMIPMLVKRDWQMMYFSILFYILAGIFLSYFLKLRETSRVYVLILTVLGLYSVICTYFLRIFPDRGIFQVPMFRNGIGVEFYNFGLAQVSLEFVKNRNFGIFREPGVYQFFLLLGIYLNNYYADWEKKWQLWTANGILSFTMLTTFATGGVLELGLLAVFLFFDQKWYRQKKARILAWALCLTVAVAAAYIVMTENSLYVDLIAMVTKFTDEESGLGRLNALLVDLEIFIRHPIFGEKFRNVLHVVDSNTTSTLVLFAVLGFFGGCFHVAGWFALCWDKKRNVFANLFLLMILFMAFNTQNLSWNLVFWLFPMLALSERGLPFLQKVREKRHGS